MNTWKEKGIYYKPEYFACEKNGESILMEDILKQAAKVGIIDAFYRVPNAEVEQEAKAALLEELKEKIEKRMSHDTACELESTGGKECTCDKEEILSLFTSTQP